jgi:hypothetical protein
MAKIKAKSLGKVTQLHLTDELFDRLRGGKLTTGQGGYQETCGRILATVRTVGGAPTATVTARELDSLRNYANRDDAGGWQDWSRAVLAHNGLET